LHIYHQQQSSAAKSYAWEQPCVSGMLVIVTENVVSFAHFSTRLNANHPLQIVAFVRIPLKNPACVTTQPAFRNNFELTKHS